LKPNRAATSSPQTKKKTLTFSSTKKPKITNKVPQIKPQKSKQFENGKVLKEEMLPTTRFEEESTPLNWNEARHLHALLAFF
jgi:hypothetical protein